MERRHRELTRETVGTFRGHLGRDRARRRSGMVVDWTDLEGPQHATLRSELDAHEPARALPHTLQDVAASIRDRIQDTLLRV